MRGIKSNSKSLVKSADKHKLLLFGLIAVFAIALALPATLSFANETTSNTDSATEANEYTISGHLYDTSGKSLAGGVMIFGVFEDLSGWSTQVNVKSDGSYSCDEVPEGLIFGAMIGISSGYAWQFLSLPSESKAGCDFYLKPGVNWTFPETKDITGLDSYAVCGGTSITTADGKLIEWTSLMPSITMDDMPAELGLYKGGTITENRENHTFTYHYKDSNSPEEYTLVFVARAKAGYKFDKWLINDKEITNPYTITENFSMKPSFVTDPGPVPEPGEVRAYIYEDSARPPATPIPVQDAYAYIVGWDSKDEVYISDYGGYDNNTGLFIIKEVPDDIRGLLVVGAPGHTNRAQYYSSLYPATNFYLSRGVQCTVDIPDEVETVMLEKGSYVDITFDDFPMGKLELPEDIDFGKYMLPFGMSFHGTFNFKDNGELIFTVDKNAFQINHLELRFKVVPKEGYVQNGWLKDGQKISGEYTLQDGEKDFTIAPNFGQDEPENPTIVNAQTFDSLGACVAMLAFLFVASAGVVLYRRLARKKK